jgi:hypothetical protein
VPGFWKKMMFEKLAVGEPDRAVRLTSTALPDPFPQPRTVRLFIANPEAFTRRQGPEALLVRITPSGDSPIRLIFAEEMRRGSAK